MSKQDDELRADLVRLFRAGHADGQARIPVGNNVYQIDQTEKLIRDLIASDFIAKAEVLRALEQDPPLPIKTSMYKRRIKNQTKVEIAEALGLTSKEGE